MNRAMRRAMERQRKKETVRLRPDEIRNIKEKITTDTINRTFEDVIPLFVMYLVEHFHCKEAGVFKFMDWFDKQMAIINEDPYRLYDYIERLKTEAGVRIEYD